MLNVFKHAVFALVFAGLHEVATLSLMCFCGRIGMSDSEGDGVHDEDEDDSDL